MNVAILSRLGKDNNDLLKVQPVRGEEVLPAVELPRSMVAALTAEMRFQLAEAPVAEMLETVDLLDFPGYRGRLKVRSMDDVRNSPEVDDKADPVAELLLRGKVAYLFERYTENQEMNVLVVCASSIKQSDVSDMGPVLENWISSTQGETPEQRAGKIPGLVWTFTMFDLKTQGMLNITPDNMRIGWCGLTDLALTEKFGYYEWLQNWTPDNAFDNVFLTRKPGEPFPIIDAQDGRETGFNADVQDKVAQLKSTFLGEDAIQRYVSNPEDAWDAVMALNDGGISRLAGYLDNAAQLENKLTRISEQIEGIIEELADHRLGAYYQKEGDEAVNTKQALAKEVVGVLGKRASRFGELLNALQLPAERLRAIYLRSEEEAMGGGETEAAASEEDAPFAAVGEMDSLIDLGMGGQDGEPDVVGPAANGAARFARDALVDWVSQLRELPEHDELLRFLGLPRKALEMLADELETGVDRLKLEQKLTRALSEAEGRTSAMSHKLVERQVLVVRTLLNDYIDYLGNSERALHDRPQSTAVEGRMLFEPPPVVASRTLPELPPKPTNYPAMYILDWFEGFKQLAVDNAGHTAGREITPQQNQRLGEIISIIAGREQAAAGQPGT